MKGYRFLGEALEEYEDAVVYYDQYVQTPNRLCGILLLVEETTGIPGNNPCMMISMAGRCSQCAQSEARRLERCPGTDSRS